MPRTMAAGEAYSSGLWLTPPRQGMKIIPAGAIRAMFIASAPAPLGIRWKTTPSRRHASSIAAMTAGSIGTGESEEDLKRKLKGLGYMA